MKTWLTIFLSAIFMMSVAFAQSPDEWIKVKKEDWNTLKETYMEIDTALTECENLNEKYEERINLFRFQVDALTKANLMADSIKADKDLQLEKRKEQVDILNNALNKKRVEIWVYRGAGAALIVFTIFLLVK